jgi:hypothetical protein
MEPTHGKKGTSVDKSTIAPYLVIALGGMLGANARYLVGLFVAERLGTGLNRPG